MVTLDIVSDVMCPWCFVGKRHLEQAMPQLDGIELDIRWRPYQLDPTIPPEGRDRREHLTNRFGSVEMANEIYARVVSAGAEAGIEFNVGAIEVTPKTLNAHRLIRWAHEAGCQDAVVERLFQRYFLEGTNLCDPDVLENAAAESGMDRQTVLDRLASDVDRDAVRDEIAMAARMGISGVLSFIVAGRYLVSGAQPPHVLADLISHAAGEVHAAA